MVSANGSDDFPTQFKILIAGGFGAGKTTFVGSTSEIEPLTTEEALTSASVGTDSLEGVENKATTTVAMDFGRITFSLHNLVLYLFGTPGQNRFWFMWDELSRGALGAVVIADTRRLQDCFAAIEFFEQRGIPFLVAVNEFDGSFRYEPDEVRNALDLKANVPVLLCDARDTRSATGVLISLIEHVLSTSQACPA
ncbi:signal recognition particle receptor subunit beta [Halopolyspora algeriensis]|uniref:Signal recognition particle receptor subunit beta n=1 Tax=Halopolyspora algeriensis TaxID=1500506 RepID=A0A368VEX4_9ACTN|nr:ATP/GTP-binding protein [Halopolyspora algeriensis]RCW39698.1 signal recognition particle receptor subunit beta [Halopolyspora algeriensis]TQM54009.1 signal recognition particle receptor subunit beta [Halopolyspora algeriensis]